MHQKRFSSSLDRGTDLVWCKGDWVTVVCFPSDVGIEGLEVDCPRFANHVTGFPVGTGSSTLSV